MRLADEDAGSGRRGFLTEFRLFGRTRFTKRRQRAVDGRERIVSCSSLPTRQLETLMKPKQEWHRLPSGALLGSLVLASAGLGACGDDHGDDSADLQAILHDGDL